MMNVTQEPRWPALTAFVAVGLLSLAHPPALTAGPRWLVVGSIGILLIPAIIAHRTGQHRFAHLLLVVANVLVTTTMLVSVGLLIGSLPKHQIEPPVLLRSAAALWATNVIVFALWYWRLDAGGPAERDRRVDHRQGAFSFPQMHLEVPGHAGWRPGFVDYLFLAFNTSTALSPADTEVLTRWAKLMMMAQSCISLTIIVILAARAVNIL
jgi:uncharacterized membrane protein